MGNAGSGYGNGYLTVDRNGMGGESLLQERQYGAFEGKVWKMKGRIVESIFAIGMSPFLMNVCACAIVIVINNSLQEHGGDMAIGAYGIINRLLTLYVMIVLGLTMGMQPIVGYNFGAQKIDRVKQTLKLGIISGVVITSSGFLICEFSLMQYRQSSQIVMS